MKPLRRRLEEARQRHNARWEVIERDYMLGWVLAGMQQVTLLRETLVFKGGTALKKCYFGDYRFSEDLDFSARGDHPPTADEMLEAMRQACTATEALLHAIAPITLRCDPYTERDPHPHGQQAFIIGARLPWHNERVHTRIMAEITMDEPLLRPSISRPILHGYDESLDISVPVYGLEEIIAEKLRAILQFRQQINARGWSRSRARDYYDLWRILTAYHEELDLTEFNDLLHRKCRHRGVDFVSEQDFFDEAVLKTVHSSWEQWLGPLVPDLPPCDQLIEALRPRVEQLIDAAA